VQILREHQAAITDQPLEAVTASEGEPTSEELPKDERLWRPRGQTIYLSDEGLPEEERIRILPPPEDER